MLDELVADYRKKGALEGVEVDIDEGYFIESPSEKRDEEFLAAINIGIIEKVKEYSETGNCDAIVLTGALDPGFVPARLVSKIPVAAAVHSGFHVASLIGERFSEIPIVCELPAGLEMAKAMVNMKLLQTARAYPGAALKVIPEYW